MLELTSMEKDFGYDSSCFYQTGTTISRVAEQISSIISELKCSKVVS